MAALAIVALGVGCGDPGGLRFDFAGHFEPDEAVVENGADETRLRMVGVDFESGTDNLTTASLLVLQKFADVFEALPGARFSIEGHTDERGASDFNQALSLARANAVRNYLVGMVGGPAVAFTTAGYGEDRPIATGSNAAAWALNERIEIVVADDTGAPVFAVSISADWIDVTLDCDDFTSSASAAAGDFYIQAEFYSDDDRGRVLGARSANTLVQLNAGESRDLAIAARERFIASEDSTLTGYVDWFENDTGGVHQFDRVAEIPRRYNAREKCWEDPRIVVVVGSGAEPDPRARCVAPAEGEIAAGTLSVDQPPSASVDGCIAELDWSLTVERVD